MNRFARSSFALLGLAVAAPAVATAQNAPAGYQPAVASPGLDGQPVQAPVVVAAPAPFIAAAPAPHAHRGRTLCARCMKAKEAQAQMAPGTIVGCAHSKNGVCTACAALLALPGTVTMGAPAIAAATSEAPGRAVVASAGAPASGVSNAYDALGMAEPTPIGVMQTNYSQAPQGGMMAPGSSPLNPMMGKPGRAMAASGPEMGPGPAPMQKKSGFFPHPHIIRHIFGIGEASTDRADAREGRKKEAHAMISYDAPGTTVNEIPASMVFGKP